MNDFENKDLEENEIPEMPSEVQENIPGEMNIEPPSKPLHAVGDKSLIQKLLKIKIILIAGIIFFAFVILVIVFGAADSTGMNDYKYKETNCKNVTITYRPYDESKSSHTETMELEEYIRSAVYEYTKSIINPPNGIYHVYAALAIALRNEVLSNNCQVTYRDKTLSKSFTSNDELDSALRSAEGVIMTDFSENIVPAKVADFCWNEDWMTEKDYVIYQANQFPVNVDFVQEHFNNDVYRDCACNKYTEVQEGSCDADKCWVTWPTEEEEEDEEEETCYQAWIHQDDTTGFNVYASYYLMYEYAQDYKSILKYFFGQDIKYMTTKKNQKKEMAMNTGNMSSYCNTSSNNANLLTFLQGFEGTGDFCDNGNGYVAYDGKDGTITVGKGVTNHLIQSNAIKNMIDSNDWGQYFNQKNGTYSVSEGQCLPVSVIDQIEILGLEQRFAAPIDTYSQKYGVTLTQFQKDALTSFNYNLGEGYTEKLIQTYAEEGYVGLWNYMKQFVNAKIDGVYKEREGLKKRRKAEFALFVTGDYTDRGLFYSRKLDNYDDYNSENVIEHATYCANTGDNFALPLAASSGFQCTSAYGYRVAPIAGATSNHSGLDLGVSGGTSILASKSGTVVDILDGVSGSNPSTGNRVIIQHEDNTKTAYYHMKINSVAVKVGDHVEQGQKIGEVGSTGASTGNHLHFTIYDASGNTVDPYNYLDLSFLEDTSACHNG